MFNKRKADIRLNKKRIYIYKYLVVMIYLQKYAMFADIVHIPNDVFIYSILDDSKDLVMNDLKPVEQTRLFQSGQR